MLIITLFAILTCAVVALLFSGRKSPAQRREKARTTTTGKPEANNLRHDKAQQCERSIPSLCDVRPEITRTNDEAP
jgi:hypothetical protein